MEYNLDFLCDNLDQIDWENLFLDDTDPLAPSDLVPIEPVSSNPDSMSSHIGELENLLMNDENQDQKLAPVDNEKFWDEFFKDFPVDSPAARFGSDEVVVNSAIATVSDESSPGNGIPDPEQADLSGSGSVDGNSDDQVNKEGIDDDDDDTTAKKRRRQLRNRDAALRSRERKKIYVKDLEMKSKFWEGECRKLGYILQGVVAENQALRLCLHTGNSAPDVSRTKQESAVLFVESLLLGSLLWYLGIVCLFTPSQLPQSVPVGNKMGNKMEMRRKENGDTRGQKNKISLSSVISRRCKGSRTRIKLNSDVLVVF